MRGVVFNLGHREKWCLAHVIVIDVRWLVFLVVGYCSIAAGATIVFSAGAFEARHYTGYGAWRPKNGLGATYSVPSNKLPSSHLSSPRRNVPHSQ